MAKFVVTTKSESYDNYVYFIEHDKKPSIKELNKFLLENGSDVDEERCYEHVEEIYELGEFVKLK